jgi:hypothetical protein
MLKTYRIIPLVFILFLFGFTLVTVAPVFAWDKSMGMRHPDRPCMKSNICGADRRSPEQKASDPWDNGGTLMPNDVQRPGNVTAPLSRAEKRERFLAHPFIQPLIDHAIDTRLSEPCEVYRHWAKCSFKR